MEFGRPYDLCRVYTFHHYIHWHFSIGFDAMYVKFQEFVHLPVISCDRPKHTKREREKYMRDFWVSPLLSCRLGTQDISVSDLFEPQLLNASRKLSCFNSSTCI